MEEASLIQLLQQRLRFSKRIQRADAAVLIAITQEQQPKVLLTRRSLHLSQHAGEVSFPGGNVTRAIPAISWSHYAKHRKKLH